MRSPGYLDAGLKSFVSGTATRQLGEHTSADVTTSWHPQAGVGLSLTTSRRLSPQLEADFTWQVGPESCVILGMTRHGERYLINGRLEVCLFPCLPGGWILHSAAAWVLYNLPRAIDLVRLFSDIRILGCSFR